MLAKLLSGFVAVLCLATSAQRGFAADANATAGPTLLTSIPKFELDIQPLLTSYGCNMGACHGKSRGQNGFALSLLGFDAEFDYQSIVAEGRGRRVFTAAPEYSLLLRKASGELPHGGGVRWPRDGEAYRLMLDWIAEGMPRAGESDPVFERIEVLPKPFALQPGEHGQLRVIAHYSGGKQRDVTSTSFYQSNETAILKVQEDGSFVAGDLPGEATIMIRYMGQIATWSAAIPRQAEISAASFDSLPTNTFVDSLVWEKLAELNILPSDSISDEKFIRRVFVDLIGRLPRPDEVRDFLGRPAEDRREQVVDYLLDQPEYADFWANKWTDLLRPNPYRVGIKATQSLDGWIRDAFRNNMPYDEFVRQLLTARGSTFRNGAVTIFRDRRSPDEITTMVSQLFLGVRLECAKCHQHPFEVYGQDDFYGLAAYFARVGYKGRGLSPPISGSEEIILVKNSGAVRHPLTGDVMQPAPLWGDARSIDEGEDPRVAFADWLTDSSNRQFAEAGANRIWGELFGTGIVDPVDDMRATNPPSNPKLLRALGEEFQRVDFDQKKLLKTLALSHVYQLSSLPNATNASDHRNYSRHYRRLSRAEVIADAISDVTGVPDQFDAMPPESRAMELWTFRTRSEMLDTFGRPDANQDPPCERFPEATMSQALHLMNARLIQSKLASDEAFPAHLANEPGAIEDKLEEVYLRVLSRVPERSELETAIDFMSQQEENPRKGWEDLLWALMNSPEFYYED